MYNYKLKAIEINGGKCELWRSNGVGGWATQNEINRAVYRVKLYRNREAAEEEAERLRERYNQSGTVRLRTQIVEIKTEE